MFDAEKATVPTRYYDNGTTEGICDDDIEYTAGQLLHSKSQMIDQKSCQPSYANAGNYYSFRGVAAGFYSSGGNAPDSVCPKGWMLTTNTSGDKKSYYNLIATIYSIIDNADLKLQLLPLSFIRTGNINAGSPYNIGSMGQYWSSAMKSGGNAHFLEFSRTIDVQMSFYHYIGRSVRCVSR